jgi:hypothetical protein
MAMDLSRLKIGMSDGRVAYIKQRHIHTLLVGKSGTGKSSSLAHWWEQDGNRISKILIEPSGFLSADAYSMSKGKALYCSLQNPISINPMQSPYDPSTISDIIAEAVNQVIALCTKEANKELTVKMRGILDEAIKYCLANGRPSLIHVRNRIVNTPGNSETRDGIIQRLNLLLNDERMIPILCGNQAVQWGELIQKGQSFILDCFGMGTEKMVFTGNIISQGIKNYFRYERPKEYKPCVIHIDECHNFVNQNFMDILKEGRKFKLAVTLATQDFSNIPEPMARAMLNVGNIVCYRVGFREANLIAKEMGISPADIQFIEKWHAAYLTPEGQGIAKISRPPLVRKIEVKVEPKVKSKGWFTLESCQPESTL